MAAATNSQIKILNCQPEHLESLFFSFEKMGVSYKTGKNWIEICSRNNYLKPFDLITHEYPGFPTDLQAPFVVLATQSRGKSLIHETIFEGRLLWTTELVRMGANITMLDPHRIIVFGPTILRGREIETPDIRAGIAFIIAGLIARGKTVINNVYQVDRGYERLEERLQKIGASIKRLED